MVSKISFTALFCSLLASFSFSSASTLYDLVNAQSIELDIESTGDHQDSCLVIQTKNLSDKTLSIQVSPGSVFHSVDSEVQDIIVTQELIFVLEPGAATRHSLVGYCCQSSNRSPDNGDKYTIGEMSDKQLQSVAAHIEECSDYSSDAIQYAIWSISDCGPVSAIGADSASVELNKFVSNLLGIEPPWYHTVHKSGMSGRFNPEVMKLIGKLEFGFIEDDVVTIVILSEEGRLVKSLVHETIYGLGQYSYPIDLYMEGWQAGSYTISVQSANNGTIGTYPFTI